MENIETWMIIDGAVGLIILVAALRGAAKGIGDTIIRMLCIAGGVGLGVMFSEKLSAFLMNTKLSVTLYERIFMLIRGEELVPEPGAEEGVEPMFKSIFTPDGTGDGVLSKSLGGIFDNAADRAAEAAAERLTEIAMAVIAFALIILAVCIAAFILRMIIRSMRDTSVVIGFADRTLGLVLGLVRGLMLAWIAVALFIPLTTMFSPEKVPAMMEALQQTTVAKVLYDVNPLFLIIRYLFK